MAYIQMGKCRKEFTKSFSYTGNIQSFVIPITGLYKLEVWGAAGGGDYRTYGDGEGPKGGYSIGYRYFQKGDTIYVVVGGKGLAGGSWYQGVGLPIDPGVYNTAGGYNGGGNGRLVYGDDSMGLFGSGGGGGATHIALVSGLLSDIGYNNFVTNHYGLIVAGGGAGIGMAHYAGNTIGANGGVGGGLSGGDGGREVYDDTPGSIRPGATQISGYAFGAGQSLGAGGGLYGGYGCTAGNNWWEGPHCHVEAASGGSGYIGGVPNVTYRGTTYSASTTSDNRAGHGRAKITLI